MKKTPLVLGFVLLFSTHCVEMATAGECIDGDADYLRVLELGPGPENPEFEYALSCLCSMRNPMESMGQWAGPNAASLFAHLRADTLNPRLARALSAASRSSWADSVDNRQYLFRLAACHGIASVDSQDVYAALLNQPVYYGIYEDLAVLQDCRAVDFLQGRYIRLHDQNDAGYNHEILDVLSCLYHIPCKEALVAARQLRARERDKALQARIQRILDRK